MRPSTLAGVLAGAGLALLGGGIAWARRGPAPGKAPYFLYVMQPGDTLGELALKFFGDAKKASVLFAALDKVPDRPEVVPAGATIRVPCVWVKVQPGETLAAVAQRTLGDGKLWRRILEANRNGSSARLKDPDKLAVGQVLAVPMEAMRKDVAAEAPAVAVGDELELLEAEEIGCA